jgi:peptidoglycan/LPS O-acetylase OafA/YrhL
MNSKIAVLHALRGIAALMVFYAHLFSVGVKDAVTPQVYVPALTGTPVAEAQRALGWDYLWPEILLGKTGISSGHLGVMLFFLISGFVISLSINRTDPLTFLIRRAIRIYPTCFAAVIFTVISVTVYCRLFNVPTAFSWDVILNSALLTSGWVGQGGLIPVLWSLSAEVAFYLLVALVVSLTRSKFGVREIFIAGLICCAIIFLGASFVNKLNSWPALAIALKWASYLAAYISYMLIGGALAIAVHGEQPKIVKIGGIASSILIYCLSVFLYNRHTAGLGTDIASGIEILILFSAVLYFGRNWDGSRITNFLGDISYPLYLLHIPLAWIVLYEVTRRGISLHLAVAAAVTGVTLLAWLFHILVEKPSQLLSQRVRLKRIHTTETLVAGT